MSNIWSKLINFAGNITGILPVANGGTGLASGLSGGVLAYTANGTLASSAALTANALVIGGGAGSVPAALALGTANQVVGMNSAATAHEYKTMAVGTTGSDFAVANATNSITFNLPDAGASARGAVTTGTQTIAGAKTFSGAAVFSSTAYQSASVAGDYAVKVVNTANGSSSDHGLNVKNTNTAANSILCQTGNQAYFSVNGAGSVQMNGYGTGTATFSSNGTISSVSDSRLKTDVGGEIPGLAAVLRLHPRRYTWVDQEKMGPDVGLGFFAQEVAAVIPEASGPPNLEGYYGLLDRPIIAALVQAVKVLNARIDVLETQ